MEKKLNCRYSSVNGIPTLTMIEFNAGYVLSKWAFIEVKSEFSSAQ